MDPFEFTKGLIMLRPPSPSPAAIALALLTVLGCSEPGPPGPLPQVDTTGGLSGDGTSGSPLAIDFAALNGRYVRLSTTCGGAPDEGAVRVGASGLDLCTAEGWATVYTSRRGVTRDLPGASCKAILAADPTAPSGWYWIDPNGGPRSDAFEVWCDMVGDGGGWTQLAEAKGDVAITAAHYVNGLNSVAAEDYVLPCARFATLGATPVVRIVMGTRTDYFRPAAVNLCAMLQSNVNHEWSNSPTGTFVRPTYYTAHLGGSQTDWPLTVDGRRHLSFWGSNNTALGGCCTTSSAYTEDWGRPFSLYVRE